MTQNVLDGNLDGTAVPKKYPRVTNSAAISGTLREYLETFLETLRRCGLSGVPTSNHTQVTLSDTLKHNSTLI